jgi:hypothetical protein
MFNLLNYVMLSLKMFNSKLIISYKIFRSRYFCQNLNDQLIRYFQLEEWSGQIRPSNLKQLMAANIAWSELEINQAKKKLLPSQKVLLYAQIKRLRTSKRSKTKHKMFYIYIFHQQRGESLCQMTLCPSSKKSLCWKIGKLPMADHFIEKDLT